MRYRDRTLDEISGLEGIVSKRKDSAYRSGPSPDWLKMKNSHAPAVKREAEEECTAPAAATKTIQLDHFIPGFESVW
jgi:ATP-dependent DNA ligase